jgi:hypothetical protein
VSKKRKELRPEDCTTEALRREYSQQQYEKWNAMSELESLDFDINGRLKPNGGITQNIG